MNLKQINLFSDKYTKSVILIILVFSFSVSYVTITYNPFLNDESVVFYYFVGKQILAGHGSEVIIPNASLSYALLNSITDNPHIHMKIISIVSAIGIIFFSYLIVRQIFNSKTAFISTIFLSVYSGLHFHSYQIQTDIFPIFLLFVSFFYITKQKITNYDIMMVAVFAGLSFMLKYQAIIIVISFLIFFLIYQKPRLKKSILFLVIFALVISPQLLFNYMIVGEIFTSNSSTLVLMEWENVPEEWYNTQAFNESFLFMKDPNLLFDNFSQNIIESTYSIILNLKYSWNNLSIFPLIPFLGLIPLFGGIYFLRKSVPRNLMPFIISFLIYFSIMCIFAQVTNTIRLFPVALILFILCAVFFVKIDKKQIQIPIIIFVILVNLGASSIMANWTLLHNDDLFDPNKEIYHQELYDISQVLVQEEDIESKILMGKNQMVAYHANSKFIRDYAFTPPSPRIQEENLDLEKHILRDGWNPYEIYFSNLYSYPNTVKDLEKIPDYLLIKPMKNIPENWETMYKSENYILLKIPK